MTWRAVQPPDPTGPPASAARPRVTRFTRAARPRPSGYEASFHAPALEVLLTPPPLSARLALPGIIAFVLLAALWAWHGRVDQVVTAPGRLVPGHGVKVVQALDRGRVVRIAVRDGDRVARGDLLLALDDRDARAELRRVRVELQAARADTARLRAFARSLDGAPDWTLPAVLPGVGPGAAARARQHLRDSVAAFRAQAATLRSERAGHEAAHAAGDARMLRHAAVLPLLAEREATYRQLMERRAVARPVWLDAHERWLQAHHEQRIDAQRLRESAQAVSRAVEALELLRARSRADTQAELERRERAAEALAVAEEQASARVLHSELRAPVDGIVTGLDVHTLGAVVTPAQALLQLVPLAGALRIEALVADEDAAFVRAGQFVAVKVDAFPYTRHGLLSGRIEHVAADATEDERQGAVFRLDAVLAERTVALRDRLAYLTPGMRVTVEVSVGRRRVAEYLLDPVLRAAGEALRER